MLRLFLLLLLFVPLGAQERIITLTPSLSEIVFALDKGSELVGVSEFASFPKEVKAIKSIGGYYDPRIETILMLRPTLVIGQMHHANFLAKLEKAGVKTLAVDLTLLRDIQKSIHTIATHIDADDTKLLDDIKQAIDEAQRLPRTNKKVMIMYGVSRDITKDAMYIAGKGVFFDEIITLCGAQNAYKEHFVGAPRLYFENLIATNPDQVFMFHSFLTDGALDKAHVLKQWAHLPISASKNKQVKVLSESYLSIPSQRVALTIKRICQEIQK